MAARSISETRRGRYLLGLCSPVERDQIESEYFADEGAFEKMLTAEDDLIDAYARGELAGDERRRFEKSFVSSLDGKDRIQFARAFASTLSPTQSVEIKSSGSFFDFFKVIQSPLVLRTVQIVAVLIFVAVLAWLIVDRRRMTHELRDLRSEVGEVSKRPEVLQQVSPIERTRTAEVIVQPASPRSKPARLRHREVRATATQPAPDLPEVKNDQEQVAISKPERVEQPINTQDAALGNSFERKRIVDLPLNANDVVGLLSLQPGTRREDYVAGDRSNQSSLTLDGVDLDYLIPPITSGNGQTTIRISSFTTWVRFQLVIEPAAIHEDYRLTLETADGRPVAYLNWIESLRSNQNIIETPIISTGDLPSGDYVLLLMGKDRAGSVVKVAEYSFKVITH